MNDENKPVKPADADPGLHNPPPKNDGPDETPVYEDIYHDDGRRNVLDEKELVKGAGGGERWSNDEL